MLVWVDVGVDTLTHPYTQADWGVEYSSGGGIGLAVHPLMYMDDVTQLHNTLYLLVTNNYAIQLCIFSRSHCHRHAPRGAVMVGVGVMEPAPRFPLHTCPTSHYIHQWLLRAS